MDYKKLAAMSTVYAAKDGWGTVDTHGLLCRMCFNEPDTEVLFQAMEGDRVNGSGEALIFPGETIEFVGKIRLKAIKGNMIGVRCLLYDKI